jgi:anti-sigma factor RsiW
MLIHGQLPISTRLAMAAHLLVCPECRRRKLELQQATMVLAKAFRAPGTPLWKPHAMRLLSRDTVVATLTLLALLWMFQSYSRYMTPNGAKPPDQIPGVGTGTHCELKVE